MERRKLFFSVFGIIFLSELGDKTQVTTMLLASERPLYVLYVALGSAMALITASFIEIMVGSSVVARFLKGSFIKVLSGMAFIIMGLLLLLEIM